MNFLKKYILPFVVVFVLALALNIFWEFFHSLLYVHYRGGEITNLVLLRAAFFDASFITLLSIPIFFNSFLRRRLWLVFVFGIFFAIGLEKYALETGRWAYNSYMPIIPILKTGLTPSIQLGLSGWVAIKYSTILYNRHIFGFFQEIPGSRK